MKRNPAYIPKPAPELTAEGSRMYSMIRQLCTRDYTCNFKQYRLNRIDSEINCLKVENILSICSRVSGINSEHILSNTNSMSLTQVRYIFYASIYLFNCDHWEAAKSIHRRIWTIKNGADLVACWFSESHCRDQMLLAVAVFLECDKASGGRITKNKQLIELQMIEALTKENTRLSKESLRQAQEMADRITLLADALEKQQQHNSVENHCKFCIFQKMCPKFTEDGRHGTTCNFASYNNHVRGLLKKRDCGVVYDRNLWVWKDTQEQLDARFIMN